MRPGRTTSIAIATSIAALLAGCGGSGADGGSASTGADGGSASTGATGGSASTGATGGSASTGGTGASTTSGSTLTGEITVLAAASLTESFGKLGAQFQAEHPGTKVTFGFGPSSGLAAQIKSGSPADVFASASQTTMDTVVSSGDVASPTVFAKNTMAIAVPPENPAAVTGVEDLADPGVKVALCQQEVPCGATAAKVFTNAKIAVEPVTREVDVKAVLTKVELDEVDAGMVYRTDVLAAGDKVKGVDIPPALNASTSYPIAVLTDAPNDAVAKAFVDYVLSTAGSSVLGAAGFIAP